MVKMHVSALHRKHLSTGVPQRYAPAVYYRGFTKDLIHKVYSICLTYSDDSQSAATNTLSWGFSDHVYHGLHPMGG